ncbi:MAG TPA: phospholipase D-like domain-containing protein [Baekduia sp.]
MRASEKSGDLTVHAVAGTHAVLLGFDVPKGRLRKLLGFAVQRTLLPDGAPEFLPNFLRFAVNDQPDGPWSTRDNPLQAFQWGDYTVTPGQRVRYTVSMATGRPGAVDLGDSVRIEIATEPSDDGRHGVWFNRGVAGSQAYARQFGTIDPRGVPAAQQWLSRGLEEAMLAFIARADGPDFALRGAFYEFSHRSVLDALRDAKASGADVQLVVADPADGRQWPIAPAWDNAEAIRATKGFAPRRPFIQIVKARHATTGIPHNKFLVLSEKGAPVAVWTGSTNITDGAIWGQSNVGHLVSDPAVAAEYLTFWDQLTRDVDLPASRTWVDANSPVPPVAAKPPLVADGTAAVFSPHTGMAPLERYVELMKNAGQAMFLTAPFGVGKDLEAELKVDRGVARYLLLDKQGPGDLQLQVTDKSLTISVGAFIAQEGGYQQFLQEHLTKLNGFVNFIHTKYLIIDPLTDHPVVITGSANFSPPSTNENDENMLWIGGDQRVADIYLTEFMRLFTHFRFRDAVGARKGDQRAPDPTTGDDGDVKGVRHLDEGFAWSAPFYEAGSWKERERLLFSGKL